MNSNRMRHVLVVGAGFSGAVIARKLADQGVSVSIIDSRSHVAGNCHTERDTSTGVLVHVYGPHIFHTSDARTWEYVQRFSKFIPFANRVKTSIRSGIYSFPINLHTINQFFGRRMSPDEAKRFVEDQVDRSIVTPSNLEEQALLMIGKDLYEAFFRGYTIKQWGCDPRLLPASILKRVPLRFNYDDNYYASRYQGIPESGYTRLIENILDHELINVNLSTDFSNSMCLDFDYVFYSGAIDAFFNREHGRLSYRTVFWDRSEYSGDYQGNAVINYPDNECPYTRVIEHKHFAPWEEHSESIIFTEYSKETSDGDIPYYPKRLNQDLSVLESYLRLARLQSNVSFVGRLGTYRYLDMHNVIAESLSFADDWLFARQRGGPLPTFPKQLAT
jgi:UDP-galactopyranose mutase